METNTDQSLSGPVGQVYSLVVGSDLLFAGTHVNFQAFFFAINISAFGEISLKFFAFSAGRFYIGMEI